MHDSPRTIAADLKLFHLIISTSQIDIDNNLPNAHLLRHKVIRYDPTSHKGINHTRPPHQMPKRRPKRPKRTYHRFTRPLLPLLLQYRADAQYDEKARRV